MVVGIRELSRDTSRIIQEFERTGEPVIVTREGRPIGALVTVDQHRLQELVLATAPEFVERRRLADEEVRTGQTQSLRELAAERGVEAPSESDPEANLTELATESTAAHLRPLEKMLAPEIMVGIKHGVADQVAALSAEMVDLMQRDIGAELEPAGVREGVDFNAAISAQLVREELSVALSRSGIDTTEQVHEVLASLRQRMRGMAESIPETEGYVVETHRAFLAGVRSGTHRGQPEQARTSSATASPSSPDVPRRDVSAP